MADQKITQLTELTAPTTDDMLAVVDDPSGSPASRKLSILKLLTLAVSNVSVQTLTSTAGTYTPTTAIKKTLFILVGGGGGGASVTAADDAGGGGGGGGTVIKLSTAAEIGASQAYVAGPACNASSSGYSTTISGLSLTAGGGGAGAATGNTTTLGAQANGGTGGSATGGDLNIPGKPGYRALIYSTSAGCGGAGGDSVFGKGAAESGTAAAGSAGTAYGGGGSGAHTADDTNRSGGGGAAGVIYAIEFLA
jgi:hypothetical protein